MTFTQGDWVKKVTGDYVFYGRVVADFFKLDPQLLNESASSRLVVQNSAGILHIFSSRQL